MSDADDADDADVETPLLSDNIRRLRRSSSEVVRTQAPRQKVKTRSKTLNVPPQVNTQPVPVPLKNEHSFLYSMMRPHSHRWQAIVFRAVILTLIVLDIIAFVLETEQPIYDKYRVWFYVIEAVSSIVFLLEYLVRVVTVPESRRYAGKSPWAARLDWIFSLESLIDVLCFMPFFFELMFRLDLPNLSVLRVLRLFRLIKAQAVGQSFDVIARVFYYNSEILTTSLVICVVLMLIMSTLLFYCRPPSEASSDDFSSIPGTMYLAIMMLSGQGNPEGNLPWYTKAIVVFTAIFAVALFAIFASMLTWGFEQEAERLMKKRHQHEERVMMRKALLIRSGVSDHRLDFEISSESSEDDFQEWKEYEEVVVGSDSDSDASSMLIGCDLTHQEQARALRVFSLLDNSEDGKITTEELACICPSEEQGKDLMNAIDPDHDGVTTAEDFICWLSSVKKKHPKVFLTLLTKMESLARQGQEGRTKNDMKSDMGTQSLPLRTRSRRSISTSTPKSIPRSASTSLEAQKATPGASPEALPTRSASTSPESQKATPGASPEAMQIVQMANDVHVLQNEVKFLRDKKRQLKQELSKLRTGA